MSKEFYHYVYGPVPSRRLGRSLGVDLVPFKTCSYDCIYCQLGRTTNKTIERREYVRIEDVASELARKLAGDPAPDYISLAGSGEPTLNSGIGRLIEKIRGLTRIPIAVLTNGSLLWKREVQDDLMAADLVVPSLDAGNDRLFQYVNRPQEGIVFEQMADGIADFTSRFTGKVWLEVLLLEGATGIESEVQKIAALAKKINPARVQLNTVSRPPTEEYAIAVSKDRMEHFALCFSGTVEVVGDFSQASTSITRESKTAQESIAALLNRRPCTLADIALSLNIHPTETTKYLDILIKEGRITRVLLDGKYFFSAHIDNETEDVRYLQSCASDFWQRVFAIEMDYLARHLEGCVDILSVGCGPAIIEAGLAERGFRVVGLDVSGEALSCAPDSIRKVVGRAEDMNFEDASFDAAIFVASLQFIEDYRKAIAKTARALRPNGRLIVMLLNPASEFFKERIRRDDSYVRKVRHDHLDEIEASISDSFQIETEYFLGVRGTEIFESAEPSEAALYIIRGTLKKAENKP